MSILLLLLLLFIYLFIYFFYSKHAQILIYDWSDKGDPEVVVEDIERVNFDFDKHNPLMCDWKLPDEWSWCEKRIQ